MKPGREAVVRELLERSGFPGASCRTAGHDGSIAAIGNVAPERIAELAALAGAIRDAGFRYVTLELPGTDT